MFQFIQDHPVAAIVLAMSFMAATILVTVEFAIMRRLKIFQDMFNRALMVGGSFDSSIAVLRQNIEQHCETVLALGKVTEQHRDQLNDHGNRIAALEHRVFPFMPQAPKEGK
jgi:riboflavin synthase